jgi:hypothetical protein
VVSPRGAGSSTATDVPFSNDSANSGAGRVVERAARRSIAVVGGIAVDRAGGHVARVVPVDGRVDRDDDRRREAAGRGPGHGHAPADREHVAGHGPPVGDVEHDVAPAGDVGEPLDAPTRRADRGIARDQFANVVVGPEHLDAHGTRLRDAGRGAAGNCDSPAHTGLSREGDRGTRRQAADDDLAHGGRRRGRLRLGRRRREQEEREREGADGV